MITKQQNYSLLLNNLEQLNLSSIKDKIGSYLEQENQLSLVEMLTELTRFQIEANQMTKAGNRIKTASFPFVKSIDIFDFDFQPCIDKQQILNLCNLDFMKNSENIILYGPPGVGKTHISVAIGLAAASLSHSVYFINCHQLVLQLVTANKNNRLDSKLRHYAGYKLLIIDEVGYLSITTEGADLLFQLVSRRYEKNSTIVTTNKQLSAWGEVFKDKMQAKAILDRLVHHSSIIKIDGPSYRMKDKLESNENKYGD